MHGREGLALCGFVPRRWLVVDFLARRGQCACIVAGPADVVSDDDVGCCERFPHGLLLVATNHRCLGRTLQTPTAQRGELVGP